MKYTKIKLLLLSLTLMFPFSALAYSSYIIPGGENIGIHIESKGIIVIGFYKINGKYNNNSLKIKDRIIKVNNIEVNSINELINTIEKEQVNNMVKLTIIRNNKEREVDFKLVNDNNKYKTGLYVKDSITGIGTLTYIDPKTGIYGALGHEIIESTTNSSIEVNEGEIFKSDVSSIDRSTNGNPGTKNASFYSNIIYGNIDKNTLHGIYGTFNKKVNKTPIKVGNIEDLKLGKAYIYTVLKDNQVLQYEINITKIDKLSDTKNIYFEITDESLLDKTGGIVQGMSGSPIIQDNTIYGAVTHVVIENVKMGYGISIKTMLEEGEK